MGKIPHRWHVCKAVPIFVRLLLWIRYLSPQPVPTWREKISPCRYVYTGSRAQRHRRPPSGTMELRRRRRFAPPHQKCAAGGFARLRIMIRRNSVITRGRICVVRGFKSPRIDAALNTKDAVRHLIQSHDHIHVVCFATLRY